MLRPLSGSVLALALVAGAACGDDGGLDEPTADVTTTVVGDPSATGEDPDADVTLEVAVGSTLDQGSAGYSVFVSDSPLEQLEQAEVDPDAIVGRTEFTALRHEVDVELDGALRTIVRDDERLYVQLDQDGWGAIALSDLEELRGRVELASDALVAVHDPGAVVRAVERSRAGAVVDDGEAQGEPGGEFGREPGVDRPDDDEQRAEMVPVPVDDIDDPFLQLLADDTGTNELRVHVWFDATGEEGFVRRMAYDLGALRDPETPGTFAVVDLHDIGTAGEVTVPGDDEIDRELDVVDLAALLGGG